VGTVNAQLVALAPLAVGIAIVFACAALGATRRPRFSARYRAAISPSNPSWQATRRLTFALPAQADFGNPPKFGTTSATHRPRFSARYRAAVSPQNRSWQATRRLTFALSFGRDCICPLLRAREVDHLHYRNLGSEIPWIDVVPLHPRTHALVTVLRRGGLRGPVNLVLRLGYGAWIAADLYVVLLVLSVLHLVHGVPPPAEVAAHAQTIACDVVHVLLRGAHLANALSRRM